jgi:hypothetical protein
MLAESIAVLCFEFKLKVSFCHGFSVYTVGGGERPGFLYTIYPSACQEWSPQPSHKTTGNLAQLARQSHNLCDYTLNYSFACVT